MLGELQRVREQVLEHLLQPLGVGVDDLGRQVLAQFDGEIQTLAVGHVPERPRAEVVQFAEADAADFHVHLAGFDLAQIQNVVDQRQQVGSGGVNGFGELHLLGRQVLVRVLGQHARQNQQVVERRAQLVAHVGQELALVLRGERQLLGLFFQRLLGLLHFAVLGFDFGLLLGQQLRLFLQLGVGLLQLELLLCNSSASAWLCCQKLLGPHGGAMVFSTMPIDCVS